MPAHPADHCRVSHPIATQCRLERLTEDKMTEFLAEDAAATVVAASRTEVGGGSAIPRIVFDAADRQLAKAGGVLTGFADSIDSLFEQRAIPFGETFNAVAASTASRFRQLSEVVSSQNSERLIGDVQRRAATRPVAALAVGAALGAVLALAFVRTAPKPAVPGA
jgi:hypothetical protein